MQNKRNQSKQKAEGLVLFIPHPRVSKASPDIPSQVRRGAQRGRDRQGQPCPGEGTQPLTSPSPCSVPGLLLGPLPALIPVLGTLRLLLGTVPSLPLLRMVPRSCQGTGSGGNEEQGTDPCPK